MLFKLSKMFPWFSPFHLLINQLALYQGLTFNCGRRAHILESWLCAAQCVRAHGAGEPHGSEGLDLIGIHSAITSL